MDSRLIAWGRRVKRRAARADAKPLPPLWFFTGAARAPDPLAVLARLPPGLCGVILRDDDRPDRLALAKAAARLCRARGLTLLIAGDARLAASLGAGLYVRGGKGPPRRRRGLRGASAHNHAELRQARRAGADFVFISPVFPTASHPGAPSLGAAGWRRLARLARPLRPFALGGINGARAATLGPACAGAGAIDAFS
ncbi:thiamine phosphate synthase [Acidocella sp.]|uniref:thiamine phosphate synthase n=1 Tax=Acidocella sp. TaxID=50710 RepID=UPI002631E41E|nr:thiamine phosphate synthase [Acidocella sp.]